MPSTPEQQRDALRMFAAAMWKRAGEFYITQPEDIHEEMLKAGLAEEVHAEEDNPDLEVMKGDPVLRLTPLGMDALDSEVDGVEEGRFPR